jgi:hypothetical protein
MASEALSTTNGSASHVGSRAVARFFWGDVSLGELSTGIDPLDPACTRGMV